jgi:HK97 family phage major capsid protein
MPWDIFKKDNEFCVHKIDADGNKIGDPLGCHETEKDAQEQIAALHANVGEKTVSRITQEQMKAICPECAEEMKRRGVKRTSVKAQDVQTVIFDQDKFTATEAKKWLKEHDMKAPEVDETENTYRFRQFDPGECSGGYATLTENMPDGVRMVVCKRKKAEAKKDEKKEESIDQRLQKIRETFYATHNPQSMPTNFWIRDVYDDHLIVDTGDEGIFEVGYSQDADRNVVFDPREKWTKVEFEYVPVKADSDMLFAFGTAVKATPDGHLQGFLVTYGDESTPDDSSMKDFFTVETDFGFRETKSIRSPVYFNHALPLKAKKSKKIVRYAEKMGDATLSLDEKGVFVDAVITNTKYKNWIHSVAQLLGWSSGTAGHLVEREEKKSGTHWIKRWPLGLDASLTPCPADPRNQAIANVKSIIEQNLEVDEPGGDAGGEPARAVGVPAMKAERLTTQQLRERIKMTPEEIQAIKDGIKADLDAEAKAKTDAEAKAKAEKDALEAQIKAAAEAIVEEKLKALKGGRIVNAGGKLAANINTKTGLGDDAFKSLAWFVKTGDPLPIRTGDAYDEWMRQRDFEMKADYHLLESTQYQGQEPVPIEVLKVIIEKRDPISIIRAAGSTIYPANSNAAVIPIEKATAELFGITSIDGSNTFTTLTTQPLDKLTATVYLFTYNVPIDLQLIDDSVFNIEGWLARRIGRGWAKTENKYGLVGTGISQPKGAVTSSGLGVTAASASALTGPEIVSQYYKLAGEYRDKAVWVMRGATEGAIRALQATAFNFVGQGETPGLGGAQGGTNRPPQGTGWLVSPQAPVYNSDEMDAIAASKKPVLVGNFEAGYAIAERKMLTILRDQFSEASKGLVNLWFYVREGMGSVNDDAFKHILTPTA